MRVSSNPESVCGGFVYTHRTSYPFHRRQVLFSSRRSTFHNPSRLYGTSHRVSSRVKCTLQPSGNEGPAKDKTDPGNGSSRKYFALYETWRNPTWLRLRSRDIIMKRSAQVPRLMDSQVLLELPQEPFFLKLSCSVVLLSLFGLLSVAYLRFNTYARSLLHNNVSSSMSRDLTVGRVMRCNPVTGIRLKDVHLAPSAEHPTAPVIFATYVDINLSGFLHCIFTRRPLSLNVTLRGGEIQVSQVIVDGPKNEPLGQWDPGLYFDQNQLSVNQEMSQTFFNVLRFVQPGHFRVQDANLFLQPANFLDYGHGDEVIEIQGFSGELTFPHFKEAGRNNFALFEMDGDFEAHAKGTPAEGGSIQVQCCMSGGDLVKLKPEDPMINLRVIGERVHANRVASFLSLPFRADHGVCSADITMEFLYKSSSLVPLMRGEAQLDDVGLRFHPDPKTPMFQRINGKLRFEGKTLFLDGPTGDLGTLPMTVVGDIHLEEGYNLMSYVRPVDVNNIINTFDVDKFVPVVGLVSGEAQLSGSLDEPVIAGWADSVGQNSVFDQLPLEHAHVSFQWDAIAGILKFSEIEARVHGGGSICGSGSLLFDLTKESPYGISQKEHSLRSPKSLCWKSSSKHRILLLPPLPRDALEIDEQAPFRPYDSMRFDFTVTDVDGSILIKQYGGAHGKMASESIGLVSGDGVLAGHMEDPNCRVTWKSTTPPPFIHLNVKSPDSIEERNIDSAPPKEKRREDKVVETSKKVESVSNEDIHSRPQLLAKTGEKITDDSFGGGDYRGLVYIKLGDLPDARRVKIRTVVKNLDARRLVWADPALQKSVAHAPHLKLSMDSYFKGVMSQRPTTILGENINPRTPRMELLGVDGALAVRNLTLNNIKFESIMSGSFSFSVSDFSLSIKQVAGSTMDKAANGRRSVPRNEVADTKSVDELTIAASVKGTADFCFRHGNSEVVTSVSRDEQSHRRAVLFARNFAIEDFVGGNDGPSSGKTLSGVINADMSLDLSSKRGDGKFSLEQPRVGPMSFSSVTGKLVWRDQDLYLEGGTVKYRRSVYEIIARCSTLMSEKGDFEWEVNVNIPRASIQDVATLVKSGNDVATAMQNPADKVSNGRREYSGGPMWIQRLSRSGSGSEDKVLYEWEVPQTIPFSDQIEWFHQYLEDKENILKLSMAQALDEAAMDHPSLFGDVDGNISGRVTLKYNSKSSEVRSVPSSANTILQAILDQLTRTSFSFQLDGRSWTVGPAHLNDVKLAGTYEDGILNVGPFTFEGKDGFGAEVLGRITNTGSINVSAILHRAPVNLVNHFSQAAVNVTGECNGRIEIEGNLSNPRALGRVVWTDAKLNGKHVQGAKTDFACINGRCILNADARIGGRRAIAPENANETIAKSLQWNESTTSGLKDLDFQKPVDSGGTALLSKRSHGGKGQGETLQVQMSAPVRFYLLKYLKGRTSSSFWSDIEPVLGGSLPSDDDWILMDVNVKKYGLLLLNAVFPELTWESGDSDIKLRVSGTLTEPVVEGKVSVRDGRVFSLLLSEPLQGIRGEIEFRKAGIVTVRSVSGRCAGKGFNANGDIFYSQFHRNRLSKSLKADIEVLKELKASDSESKKQRKLLQSRQSASRSILAKTRQGLTLDFGEFPVNFQNVVLSKLSGKVHIVESLANPVVSGALTFSDGLISLGNAVGTPRNTLEDRRKNFTPQDLRPQSDEFLVNGETKGADENGSEADIESSTKPLRSGNVNPILDDFRVNIGRGMKFVQPLMLSLDTNGALVLNGSPRDPVIEGEIRALRGRVNLFATRMSIRKHAKNYIRFVKPNKTNASKTGDGAEPLINATLESEDLLVRIPECSLSKWAAHIEVTNKSGERLSGSSWDALVQSELGELRNPETMARFLTKYVFKAVEAGGKAGKFEWRMFPTIVKRNDGEISRQLKDEIGAGGEVEMGGLAIGGKRSSDGTVGGNMRLRVRDWLSWEVEKEGMKQTSRIKMKVNLTGRRKKKYKYTRRDLQTGQHDEQQNGSRREMKGQAGADPVKEGGELHAGEPENAAEGFRETPNAEGEKSPEGKRSAESTVKQFGTNGVVSKPGGTDSSQKVREEK